MGASSKGGAMGSAVTRPSSAAQASVFDRFRQPGVTAPQQPGGIIGQAAGIFGNSAPPTSVFDKIRQQTGAVGGMIPGAPPAAPQTTPAPQGYAYGLKGTAPQPQGNAYGLGSQVPPNPMMFRENAAPQGNAYGFGAPQPGQMASWNNRPLQDTRLAQAINSGTATPWQQRRWQQEVGGQPQSGRGLLDYFSGQYDKRMTI